VVLKEVEEWIKRRSSLKADWQLFAFCTPCTMREKSPKRDREAVAAKDLKKIDRAETQKRPNKPCKTCGNVGTNSTSKS